MNITHILATAGLAGTVSAATTFGAVYLASRWAAKQNSSQPLHFTTEEAEQIYNQLHEHFSPKPPDNESPYL